MNKNKNSILKTSRKLFLKYGYNGTSLRTIARKTLMTTGAIYFHFKNKKEIYLNICKEAMEILTQKVSEGISEKATPPEKLISTFDSYINFFYEHQDYYNILMEYRAVFNPEDDELKDISKKNMTGPIMLMTDVVEEGIRKNYYRDVDSRMLSVFLAAVAEGMLQYKKTGLLDVLNISDNDFRSFMFETVWKGIKEKKAK